MNRTAILLVGLLLAAPVMAWDDDDDWDYDHHYGYYHHHHPHGHAYGYYDHYGVWCPMQPPAAYYPPPRVYYEPEYYPLDPSAVVGGVIGGAILHGLTHHHY